MDGGEREEKSPNKMFYLLASCTDTTFGRQATNAFLASQRLLRTATSLHALR